MEPNELMINDIIYEEKDSLKNGIFYSLHKVSPQDFINSGFFEKCKPILLTTEILKKNGFIIREETESTIDFIYHDIELFFCKRSNNITTKIGYWNIVNVESVHKLQHIFRLCSLNKLADNFIV